MNTVSVWVLLTVAAIALALFIVHLLNTRRVRKVIPSCYEWLPFLDHTIWRSNPEIWAEMIVQKEVSPDIKHPPLLLSDLESLEDKGLVVETVEYRRELGYDVPIYRLTSAGRDWRDEMLKTARQASTRSPVVGAHE